MKKTIGLISILVLSIIGTSNACAQYSPLTFGFKAGLNISSMNSDFKSKLRYQVGVTVDYEISNNFYILTGLDFTVMGGKRKSAVDVIGDSGETMGEFKVTTKPMYLKVPIALTFKFSVGENTRLFFNSGPYMAVGVGGKSKMSYRLDGIKTSSEVNYFGKGRARRFDFGLGLGAGIESNKWVFSFNYDYGLVNKQQVDDLKAKNRNIALTVGYKFF